VPERWLVPRSARFFARDEEPLTSPTVRPQGARSVLCFEGRPGLVIQRMAAAPLTPYVFTLKLRTQQTSDDWKHFVLWESTSADRPLDETELDIILGEPDRWLLGQPAEICRDYARQGRGRKGTMIQKVALLDVDPDGFETWRFEYITGFSTRSMLVALVGTLPGHTASSSRVEIDEIFVHEVAARDALGSSLQDLLPCFPDASGNLDSTRRISRVRRDGDSRPAQLLAPGCTVMAHFFAPPGARLRFGLCVVPEDRCIREGDCTVVTRFSVRQSERVLHEEQVPLVHARARVLGWTERSIELPANGSEAGPIELVVEAPLPGTGEIDPGPLVAVSEPLVVQDQLGIGRSLPPPLLRFILISVDTLRADRLGRTVDGQSLTPSIDAWRSGCLVFADAVASSSWTLPSHVSMFTSQSPIEHGVFRFGARLSPKRSSLLAEQFARAGFVTAAFTGGGMLNPDFCRIDQGFDRFCEIDPMLSETDALLEIAPRKDWPEYNRSLSRRFSLEQMVIPWIEQHRDLPFFLFVHTYQVHNYEPGNDLFQSFEERRMQSRPLSGQSLLGRRFNVATLDPRSLVDGVDLPYLENLYDATVHRADREIGRLIDALKRLGIDDDTVVCLTSDHGEEFLEHGGLSHSRTLYEEMLRIPLILKAPGAGASLFPGSVSHLDLAPTLLDLAGIPVPATMRGCNLLARKDPAPATIHAGVRAGGWFKSAVREQGWKYMFSSETESSPEEFGSLKSLLEALGYADGTGSEGPGKSSGRVLEELFNLTEDPREIDDRMRSAPVQEHALLLRLRERLALEGSMASSEAGSSH